MTSLLRFFVDRHLLVNIMAATLAVLGYLSAVGLQREFIPAIDTPILWITATLRGASARDVETKITIPLEDAIEEVEGLDQFFTTVSDNTSFTTVELDDNFDGAQIESAEIDLRAAVDGITDFPEEMEDEPIIKQLNTGRRAVVEVALTGAEDDLNRVAKDLEERIERLPQIASVTVVGLPDPELRILVDPVKAKAHGITLDDVITALERRNVSSTGGLLESATDRRQVVMWSRFDHPTDAADTLLRFDPGSGALRIRDIARIEHGREDTGLIVHTGGRRGIVLVANKRELADIIDAAVAVRNEVNSAPIPDSVEFTVFNDESTMVKNRLRLIATNGALGAILVIVILFLFMTPQPAIWILIGIPIVFLGSLTLFRPFGMSLNMLSLTGLVIVLGMIVDDAVVISERIAFKKAQGLDATEAAISGVREMLAPVTAAALTTAVAFGPLTALGGEPGKIMWQIPAVVIIALFFSLFESFFILPAHMSTIRTEVSKRDFVRALERRYRGLVSWVLHHRLWVILLALGILVAIFLLLAPRIPFILFPQDDADRLYVKVTAPIGTPLEQTEGIVSNLERQITSITATDLETLTSRIGHQNIDSLDKERGEADHEAVLVVQFRRFDRAHTNARWIQLIEQQLETPEDVDLVFQSKYLGPPTDLPVTIHVLSNDDEIRRGAAFEIANYLHHQDGVIEIQVDERPGTPQIELNPDFDKLALMGLDAQTLGRTLSAAFFGVKASEHRDLDDTTEFRVQFEPGARANLDALLDVPVRSVSSKLVSLRDVVEPLELPALTRIYHRDGYRASTVRASFSPDSALTALSFNQRLKRELFPRFNATPGLLVYSGGEAAKTEKTTGRMAVAAGLAFAGIGVIIWLMLGSFLEALFVMLIIPFGIAGVFLIFFLHGKMMSMFSLLGVIGLSGVVVNSSIVMVDAIHRRVKAQHVSSEEDASAAVVDAVTERLRPILVTSLTTMAGVLPTAYGIGGYDPMVSPMSLAIGWGLLLSTVTTLFIIPVLYTLARDVRRLLTGAS